MQYLDENSSFNSQIEKINSNFNNFKDFAPGEIPKVNIRNKRVDSAVVDRWCEQYLIKLYRSGGWYDFDWDEGLVSDKVFIKAKDFPQKWEVISQAPGFFEYIGDDILIESILTEGVEVYIEMYSTPELTELLTANFTL